MNEIDNKIEIKEKSELISLFEKCSPIFIALGDKIRQQILMEIVESGNDGMNVADLTSKSHLSRPAISHHLKVLKDAKLIEPNKIATQVFYKLKILDIIQDLKVLITGIEDMTLKNQAI